ncbi:MAG: outer membrane beta-barrel protein [Candidatus Cryptobacteroides sp.]
MEDWTNRFSNRFNGYEMPEPEGLWEAIDATIIRKRRARSFLVWSGMAGGIAAAAVAIFLMLDIPGRIPDGSRRMYADNIEVLRSEGTEIIWESEMPQAKELFAMGPKRQDAVLWEGEEPDGRMADEGMGPDGGMDDEEMEPVLEGAKEESEGKAIVDIMKRDAEDLKNGYDYRSIENANRNIRKKSNISASLSYGNGAGSSGVSQGYRTFFVSQAEGLEMNVKGAAASIMTLNGKDAPAETKTKHHLPLRAGLCIRWEFFPKLSIETGLTYTLLSSEMTSGSERYNYVSKQKLNYLGIPLNLNYSFLDTGLINLYISAGGLMEKCIGGRISTDYISNGSVAEKTDERLKVNPLQWSVNLGAGLQINFIKKTGLFIQPGISWYFDNDSPVETIYSAHPVNFDFRFGIRHSF